MPTSPTDDADVDAAPSDLFRCGSIASMSRGPSRMTPAFERLSRDVALMSEGRGQIRFDGSRAVPCCRFDHLRRSPVPGSTLRPLSSSRFDVSGGHSQRRRGLDLQIISADENRGRRWKAGREQLRGCNVNGVKRPQRMVAASASAAASTSLDTATTVQNARSPVNRLRSAGIRFSSSVPSDTRRRRALRTSSGRTADVTQSFRRSSPAPRGGQARRRSV